MTLFEHLAHETYQTDFCLSRQARTLWAKTGTAEENNLWEPLYVHMLDSAGIAWEIWSRWLASSTRSFVVEQTGLDAKQAAILVAFLAGIHDIGKATPNFQQKVPERAERAKETGLSFPEQVPGNYSHAFMGELIFQQWLENLGWDQDIASGLACVIGGHHGAYPSTQKLSNIENTPRSERILGDSSWQEPQRELFDFIGDATGFLDVEPSLRSHQIPTSVQVLLTGIVIMADWITSNVIYFPLAESLDSLSDEATRVSTGWRTLALPEMESFVALNCPTDELFRHRFPQLPDGAQLRPVQEAAVQCAQEAAEPCLLIIEADTGGGKTEASLLAAEILADKFGSGGLAYLLPTQATSNAMYARVERWLETLHADNDSNRPQDIHLLHGKAELNEDWKARASWGESWMGDAGKSEQGRSHFDEAIIAHQWFSGHKRGLLAPFVVGTVDQLLFMALNAKHVQLRHLGLAGKVVIIDEVHAYDAYMNIYLDRALAFLGAYRVPVILLSATLPPARRDQLLRAYQGKDARDSSRSSRRKEAHVCKPPRTQTGSPAYPLITSGGAKRHCDPTYLPCSSDARKKSFNLELLPDNDEALEQCLREHLTDGGCICVLRNTVARAQHAYELLSTRLKDFPDIQIELVHSRFISLDRAENDKRLLEQLGPRSAMRPRRLVVIGTQVIEQSLDIDFDMLITDIAPVDLLLQRMGRVHRHNRGFHEEQRPPKLQSPKCFITGIEDWDNEVPHFERGTSFVYQQVILLRTALALGLDAPNKSGQLTTPDDTAALVEKVYAVGNDALVIPESWQSINKEASDKAEKTRHDKEQAAQSWRLRKLPSTNLQDWMNEKTSLTDEVCGRAKVRDSQESLEAMLVVRRGGHYEVLPWVAEELGVSQSLGDGLEIPPDEVARAAALCTVGLPAQMSAPYIVDGVIDALEGQGRFDGWQESRWLRGQLPLILDDSLTAEIMLDEGNEHAQVQRSFMVCYSRENGLSCNQSGGES